jgi:ribonuclease BN (tRNA processing enzyme)
MPCTKKEPRGDAGARSEFPWSQPVFAKNADVLIMHLAIAAGAPANPLAAPAVVGRIAQEAHVRRLVVSHLGVYDLDAAIAELKTAYTGLLIIGADLQCTPIAR